MGDTKDRIARYDDGDTGIMAGQDGCITPKAGWSQVKMHKICTRLGAPTHCLLLTSTGRLIYS